MENINSILKLCDWGILKQVCKYRVIEEHNLMFGGSRHSKCRIREGIECVTCGNIYHYNNITYNCRKNKCPLIKKEVFN